MDLKVGLVFANLEGRIVSVGEIKSVNTKYNRKIKLAIAKFESDMTGEIELALWGENATAFRADDKVKMTKVEVHEFQGTKSLSVAPPTKGGSIVRV